ncbi:hypothetical protein ES703_35554 [subsurface metagenome]
MFGCHQFLLHPLCVLITWRRYFRKWPLWWQIICIFLHDVGICGRNYLSDPKSKKGHWELGAVWSEKLVWRLMPTKKRRSLFPIVQTSAYYLCAGHSPSDSGFPRSALFWADKMSWLMAPMWWLWWNYRIEGYTTKPKEWKEAVRLNLTRKNPIDGHELYRSLTGIE